ncbi:hypothetical protein D3C81_1714590 [compost metagenome]
MHDRLRGDQHARLGIEVVQEVAVGVEQVVDLRAQQHQRMARRNVARHLFQGALPVILRDNPDPRRAVAIHRNRLLARGFDDLRQALIEFLHAHFRVAFHSPHCLTPGVPPRLVKSAPLGPSSALHRHDRTGDVLPNFCHKSFITEFGNEMGHTPRTLWELACQR